MLTKERINNAKSGILNLVPCHKLYILDPGTRFMCLFHFVMDLKYGHIIHYKVVPRMSRKLCRSCPFCNYFQLLPLFLLQFMTWSIYIHAMVNWFCNYWIQSDEAGLFPASYCRMFRDHAVPLFCNHWGQSWQCFKHFFQWKEMHEKHKSTSSLFSLSIWEGNSCFGI